MREETRLTCSCGIGPNRLLAKVAADLRKPDGQFAVRPDNASIERFVTPLPLRKVPGIGKVRPRAPLALLAPCPRSSFPCQGALDLRGWRAGMSSM